MKGEWATPARIAQLLAEDRRLKPWPDPVMPKLAPANFRREIHTPADWGSFCGVGFVSSARFASNPTERVIKRTNRAQQRKQWKRDAV